MESQNDERLTARECEVAYWLLLGLTAKQVGRVLDISPRTVETHIHALMLKTRARNRVHMAANILLKKLISFGEHDLAAHDRDFWA